MTLNEIESFCRGLPGCEVRYPFESNPELRAWCLGKKMFAWTITSSVPIVVQLKANPELISTLIESYEGMTPGYHMNKRHWISVDANMCEESMLRDLLEDAHALIANALPRAERIRLLGD